MRSVFFPLSTFSPIPVQKTTKPGVACVTPGCLKARGGPRPMSRARGIRGFFATQTCATSIRKACRPKHQTGKLPPELGTNALRCQTVRHPVWLNGGKPPAIALTAIEYLA